MTSRDLEVEAAAGLEKKDARLACPLTCLRFLEELAVGSRGFRLFVADVGASFDGCGDLIFFETSGDGAGVEAIGWEADWVAES